MSLRLGAAMLHGHSNCGSIRASRARVRASRRSSFFRLSPIKRTLRACATNTSCPNSLNNRLTQGECIPVSNAMRLRGIPPNTSFIAFGVVPSRCSSTTSPCSSNTQYQLERSPRSKPIVSFCSGKFLFCFVATVLIFFIAGLLYLLRFERVDNLGAYSIPSETGLLIPSDYVNHRQTARDERSIFLAIAALRTPLWLPSGWGCRGRHLSRG